MTMKSEPEVGAVPPSQQSLSVRFPLAPSSQFAPNDGKTAMTQIAIATSAPLPNIAACVIILFMFIAASSFWLKPFNTLFSHGFTVAVRHLQSGRMTNCDKRPIPRRKSPCGRTLPLMPRLVHAVKNLVPAPSEIQNTEEDL